jgi:flagellin
LRINRASDDAAGLAIADSLNADARVYGQAIRNVNDGVSALSIADGALGQLSNIVIRQKEFAEQAANGVYSSAQCRAMHTEANALINEFNRIVGSTAFNGVNLLDGSYLNTSSQAGYGLNGGLRMGIGDDLQRAIGDGTFTVSQTLTNGIFPTYINSADFNGDGYLDLILSRSGAGGGGLTVLGNGDGTFRAPITINGSLIATGGRNVVAADFNNDGAADLFTSNNPAMYSNVSLSNVTDTSYVGYLNLMSKDHAREAMTILDQTLRRINLERGRVGSLQSRF